MISVPLTVINGAEQIAKQRKRVCEVAREWLRTPYHDHACVKGAGADCAMFPFAVYVECGVIPKFEIPHYAPQWMLHRSEEIYLRVVEQHGREVDAPSQGDFVLYHFGRCWAHGGIVLEWPLIIHALTDKGVLLADGEREGCLVGRKKRFFSPWK